MPKTQQYSVAERQEVITLHRTGRSCNSIADELRKSRGFVRGILAKFARRKPLEDAHRKGRPSALDKRGCRQLVRVLNGDRQLSSAELNRQINGVNQTIVDRTIRRYLGRAGFKRVRATSKPLLTLLQQLRRRKWATAHKQFLFDTVIFTDEKRFVKRPDGPRMVWRRPGERLHPKCIRKTLKFGGGSIMVWGAICRTHTFPLVRVVGTLDAHQYRKQILRKFVPLMSGTQLVLQQDGAPRHTAHSTVEFLNRRNVPRLATWPANSPDLSPIENVWSWMEDRLKNRMCRTDDELWDCVQAAWAAVTPAILENLFDSMPRRLRLVRKHAGGSIRY